MYSGYIVRYCNNHCDSDRNNSRLFSENITTVMLPLRQWKNGLLFNSQWVFLFTRIVHKYYLALANSQ